MTSHEKIVSALRSGDHAFALAELDRLLAAGPDDPELLNLKSLALVVSGRGGEAIECARRALSHATSPVLRIKLAGNLARLLASAGRRDELAALAEEKLPRPESLAESEFDAGALENLCAPLLSVDRQAFVAGFLEPVLDRPAANWALEHLWLRAAMAAGQNEKILARIDSPSYRWRDHAEASGFGSAAAARLEREADSDRLYERFLAATPLHLSPRAASQIMTVVVISQNPPTDALSLPTSQQYFRGNFPSQLASHQADRYRFLSIFAGSPPRSLAPEIGSGQPAITMNNFVNGEELKRGALAKVEAHEQALGLPVINAAAKAIHCTRVETSEMLRGIPNLIVPKAMRFRLEAKLLDALNLRIRELFALPVILRSVGEQEGANIHLAGSEAELASSLSDLLSLGNRDIYVIDYAGVEHENGFFRRIRAAFVEGTPTVIRADYDDQWMVRGRKFERILDHYRRDRALFDDANAFVERPERIGDAAWKTLMEVGRRIPLDVFGMDFDVDGQGRVVFFESNATMLLLSNAPPDLDYPQEAQRAFLKRIDALFRKRAGL